MDRKCRLFLLRHGLDALHADFDSLGSAVDGGCDGAQVRKKYSLVDIVRMGNGVPGCGVLAAHFARF